MGNTWLDLVRYYFPDANDEMADYILWEWTAFPMGGIAVVRRQLREARQRIKAGQTEFCDYCFEPPVKRGMCRRHHKELWPSWWERVKSRLTGRPCWTWERLMHAAGND